MRAGCDLIGIRARRAGTVIAAALSVFASAAAQAEPRILAECGDSSGTAYRFEGGIVGPGQGGWTKDGITGGKLQLTSDGGELDLRFVDVSGKVRSHRAEGSLVHALGSNPQSFLVVAENVQAGTLEHFLFRFNEFGIGTVAWGTVRTQGLSIKSSLMTAQCRQAK